jgi:hypothetical protein
VASVAQVQAVVNNVAQNPSDAFTVSGNTITFTSAPSSGTNNIYVYYTSPITQVIAPGQGTVTPTSLASSTGSGAVVLGTSPTINSPTITSPTISSPVTTGTPTGVGVLTSGTAVASTSGTAIDFTGIPSWVKRVTVMFDQVSTNGASIMQIQLGTSSGIQATSYNSTYSYNGPSNSGAAITTGFGIFHNVAGDNKSGLATFTLFGNNTWVAFGGFANLGTQPGYTFFTSGSKALGATLDRLRITTVNGTDVFDLGSINILYE